MPLGMTCRQQQILWGHPNPVSAHLGGTVLGRRSVHNIPPGDMEGGDDSGIWFRKLVNGLCDKYTCRPKVRRNNNEKRSTLSI